MFLHLKICIHSYALTQYFNSFIISPNHSLDHLLYSHSIISSFWFWEFWEFLSFESSDASESSYGSESSDGCDGFKSSDSSDGSNGSDSLDGSDDSESSVLSWVFEHSWLLGFGGSTRNWDA